MGLDSSRDSIIPLRNNLRKIRKTINHYSFSLRRKIPLNDTPQTIKHAEDKLDKAEAVLDLHTDQLVEGLTGDSYRDSYREMLVDEYVKAEQAARNAETQFLNYEDDFKKVLTGELEPEKAEEKHGIRAGSWAYTETFESVKHMLERQEVLERQVEAIDQVMQQNQLGSLKEEIREKHPWYSGDPEFRTAAEI